LINRLVFHLYRVVFRWLSRAWPAHPVELKGRVFSKILVFSAAGIGDTLTDSVAIRALKETYPKAEVTVVTHRRRAVLAGHNPFADRVVLYHKSPFRFIGLALHLRQERFDVVVMLRGNDPDVWPLAWLVNRHAVVSCPVMTQFKFLISHPVEIPEWDRTHGVGQTLEIVRSTGADTRQRRLVYRVNDYEATEIRERMRGWGKLERPWVVFQVGGGRRSAWRDWPAANYAGLGRRLLEAYEVELVLLGGGDLREKAEAIHAALDDKGINLAGLLSLAESAALLSQSKVLVSTDTGIMHLGFAVGVDTLALIHCNNPASRVGPYDYGEKHLVIQLEPPEGVAASKEVDMVRITPEKAWAELRKLCDRNGFRKADLRWAEGC
jgi:ADP-heptose:LPS heptosyltransferase